jgi:ATP-dependent helicase/nuclease subunit B
VNLPGWQDAPWEPAPHLIVFGMNDNFVPGGKSAHPYLPASLRRALGLQSPEQTFANAAFVFEQLRRRRSNPEAGRLDIIVPQFSDEGEGLKPSRLLFLAPIDPEDASADALLGPKGRINKLFRELPQERSLPYWEIPLGCRFDPAAPLEKVGKIKARAAATDLRMFLNNAQEYWLKKALGTRENDHDALELSAAEFGVLIHSAMEAFKADKAKADNLQAGRISAELTKYLEAIAAKRLGSTPSPALRNQVAAAAERMAWLAEVEAGISQEWETVAVEAALPELDIGGFTLHGRFDRLDRHRTERHRWRVYDYKTTNNPETPKEAHVSKYANNHKADDAFVIGTEGTKYRWKDVQLVVYDWCLQEGVIEDPALKQAIQELRTEGSIVEVAYINISNNKQETRLEAWEDFNLFRQAGRDAIRAAAQKLLSGDHKVFTEAVITGDGAKYPLLPGLKERKTTDYMIGENFGKVR